MLLMLWGCAKLVLLAHRSAEEMLTTHGEYAQFLTLWRELAPAMLAISQNPSLQNNVASLMEQEYADFMLFLGRVAPLESTLVAMEQVLPLSSKPSVQALEAPSVLREQLQSTLLEWQQQQMLM